MAETVSEDTLLKVSLVSVIERISSGEVASNVFLRVTVEVFSSEVSVYSSFTFPKEMKFPGISTPINDVWKTAITVCGSV